MVEFSLPVLVPVRASPVPSVVRGSFVKILSLLTEATEMATFWPLAGGKRGACRTVNAATGSLDEYWRVSEAECQAMCFASPDCIAIDYHSPYERCELHKEPIRHVLPMGEHACRLKPPRYGGAVTATLKNLNSEKIRQPAPPLPTPPPSPPSLPPPTPPPSRPPSPPPPPPPPSPPPPPPPPPPLPPPSPPPPSPPPLPPPPSRPPSPPPNRCLEAQLLQAPAADFGPCSHLRLAELRRQSLRGASFDGVDMRGALLDGADLRGASMRSAVMAGASARGARLEGAVMVSSSLSHANFSRASLRGADLTMAAGEGASFEAADLSDASLLVATLRRGLWAGADLQRAKLAHADLSHGDFRWSADFRGAVLTDVSRGAIPFAANAHRPLPSRPARARHPPTARPSRPPRMRAGAIDAHRAHWEGAVGSPIGIELDMFLHVGL